MEAGKTLDGSGRPVLSSTLSPEQIKEVMALARRIEQRAAPFRDAPRGFAAFQPKHAPLPRLSRN